jgi:hypothetical protein
MNRSDEWLADPSNTLPFFESMREAGRRFGYPQDHPTLWSKNISFHATGIAVSHFYYKSS